VKPTVVCVACRFCSILPLVDVKVDASQNVLNIFVEATYN